MSGYHVCCDQYKRNFFNEFSHLQHDEEFVDLTLAADGHLVKVHKNVIAVASPYLKEMLKFAASQSPVIFLNNVNHIILKYIIEYIYQGEVTVPVGLLKEFVDVAKALHINGISTVDHKQVSKIGRKKTVEPVFKRHETKIAAIAAHITINNVNNSHSLEVQKCNELEARDSDFNGGIEEFETRDYNEENLAYPTEDGPIATVTLPPLNTDTNNEISGSSLRENFIGNSESMLIQNIEPTGKKLEIVIDGTKATLNVTGTTLDDKTGDITENTCVETQNFLDNPENQIRDLGFSEELLQNVNSENAIEEERDGMVYDDSFNALIQVHPLTSSEAATHLDSLNNIELDKVDTDDLRNMAQYTLTQRGIRQLILNRYMYCCQFESKRGLRIRWRCIDYRRSRCPAMIDMENDKILKRTGAHTHGFHDKKIYKKHRKGLIFNTLSMAKDAFVDNPKHFVD